MGLFDFLKRKNSGIEDSKFNSPQFQMELSALALWKYEENKGDPQVAIQELKKLGLNDEQADLIIDRIKDFLSKERKNKPSDTGGIDPVTFQNAEYQNEMLDKAYRIYFSNQNNYEAVKQELPKLGLNGAQTETVIGMLKNKIAGMVADFQKEVDSGRISEIRIMPNPDLKKGQASEDDIAKYIGFGAYQMENGYLDNALELFDQAIELDDRATLAYANKGKLYSLKNDHEKALFFTNKALEIEPDHKQILDNKVQILFDVFREKKDEAKFIADIKDVLTKDPENPNALIYLIQYDLNHNRAEEAATSIKLLFLKHYSDQQVIQVMLDTFHRLSEEQALKEFDAIDKEAGEDAKYQLQYNKGLYLKGLGKYDDAISLYADLNKIQEFSWNYYQMAIMKNLQGKTADCIALLKTTFQLEPGLKEDAKNFPQLENLRTDPAFVEITK